MTFKEWWVKTYRGMSQLERKYPNPLVEAAWKFSRIEALEEVAKLMEQEDVGGDPDDLYTGRTHRAAKIRALKEKP